MSTKKFLVVIDMQNDFIDGALGTPEAVAIVPNVLEELNKDYDMVFATRDTHDDLYMETQEGKHLPVVHCVEGTHGWQLQKDIEKAINKFSDHFIFDKPTFGSVALQKRIDIEHDIQNMLDNDVEVTIVGLCTDICVISNALLIKAVLPDVPIYVKENCCAGVTPESHRKALDTMKMCHIDII